MKPASWMIAVILLAGAGTELSSVGYSFDARPRSIYRADHSAVNALPRMGVTVKPEAVQQILDGTDPVSRAQSWFNAATGEICRGRGITRTCR